MELRRVVVTGLGALTPVGNSADEYWQGLVQGVSGAGPITRFDPEKFKTRFACEVKDFDPLNFFDRKEARKMDLFTQFALVSADQAIADARLEEGGVDKDRVGVIVASGIGGLASLQKEIMEFAQGDGTPRFTPFFIPKMIPDIAPGHISIKYGYRGPNFATVSACASSSNSLIDAFNYIRLNMADVIVAGGAEAAVTESGIGGFNSMKALSERNDDFATASRPFDKDRDGFVLGEGGGMLILEEYEHAKRRGAKIYAEVIGAGMSADAYHITAPHPEGEGITLVMRNAIKDAGIDPTEMDYVNVHGTSTPLGDAGELNAIQKVFGDHAYKMNISSTKSMTGHLLGAAGGIEAIACVKSLEHQEVPPTINHFTDDPNIDAGLNLTFNASQKRELNIVMSNTFGFGGHNTSVIFRKLDA